MMNQKINLSEIRNEYLKGDLNEKEMHHDPIVQFGRWMDEVLRMGVHEPTAMLLATAGRNLQPTSRVVLLKDYDSEGFIFFTNYESTKGKQIAENPFVSATFFWKEVERQVHIHGKAVPVESSLSDEYFHARPYESRLGALVSAQSRKISDRKELETKFEELSRIFRNQKIPRPKNWGGYKIFPDSVEFWQGRSNRLHDRFLYETDEFQTWKISRLSP